MVLNVELIRRRLLISNLCKRVFNSKSNFKNSPEKTQKADFSVTRQKKLRTKSKPFVCLIRGDRHAISQ